MNQPAPCQTAPGAPRNPAARTSRFKSDLAAGGEDTEEEADTGGDADRRPWTGADIGVRVCSRSRDLLLQHGFRLCQSWLDVAGRLLDATAYFSDLVAGLRSRCLLYTSPSPRDS